MDTGAANAINCEVGQLSGGNIRNGHLSSANLQYHYHRHNRIFLTGTMNGGGASPTTTFLSAQPHKLQTEIEFPVCCDDDPDPMNQIRTELGEGKVKSMNKTKNSVIVELLY